MSLTRITNNVIQDSTITESKLVNPYVNVSGDTMTGPLSIPLNGLTVGNNQLVASQGNVGINTLNPLFNLDVNGTLRVTGNITSNSTLSVSSLRLFNDGTGGVPALYFNSETNTGIYKISSGTFGFSSSGSTSAIIGPSFFKNSSGIFSITRSGSTNSTDNVIEYDSNLDAYYFGRDASYVNFRTGGSSQRITIDSSGRVGVGTATTISGVLLNVAGRINSSSGYSGILLSDLPSTTIPYGGTGLTSYSTGDILYYSSGNSFSILSAPGTESLLFTSGTTPSWVPSPLRVTHGGTGLTIVPDNGQILIGNGNSFTLNTISSGTGITIVNSSGNISIGVSNIPNSSIANSSILLSLGTGLTGDGSVSLGGTLSLSNSGVTSLIAGTGVTISGSTGNITVSNSGVTSAIAGSGITISSSTGNVTYSLNPNFSATFSGLSLSTPLGTFSGGTGITNSPAVNQILYGNNTGGYSQLTVIGVGVTITPDFDSNTLTFSADLTGATVSSISKGSSIISIPETNGDILFTAGGGEVLRIANSQEVGIGNTNPSCKVDFGNSVIGYKRIVGLYTNSSLGQFVGLGLSPTAAAVRIAGTPTSVTPSAEIASIGYYSSDSFYNFTSVLYATNNNRIGINNTSPTCALDVTGDLKVSGSFTISELTVPNAHVASVVDVTTTTTNQVTLTSFSATQYRSAKYIIQVLNTNNTLYQVSEVLVIHDGSDAYFTEYAIINNGTSLGVLDANISGGNVVLLFTPTYSNNKIRVLRTLIAIQ